MQSGVTEPLARTVTLPATKKDKGQPEDTFTEDWNTQKLIEYANLHWSFSTSHQNMQNFFG